MTFSMVLISINYFDGLLDYDQNHDGKVFAVDMGLKLHLLLVKSFYVQVKLILIYAFLYGISFLIYPKNINRIVLY